MLTNTTRKSLYVAVFTALVFLPLISRMAVTGLDYKMHISVADEILKTGIVRTPHFLLQAFAILFSPATGGTFNATIMTLLISVAATAMLIYRYLRSSLQSEQLALYFTATLVFATPIAVLFPLDGHLYLGYIGINLLHNPTMFLLKPFALLLFIQMTRSLESDTPSSLSSVLLYAIISVAAASAKPSFTIIILPALSFMMLILILKGEAIDKKIPLFSILIPSIVILIFQYMMTYSGTQVEGIYKGNSSIIFSPLLVMGNYSSYLLPKLLFSVTFPLTVTVLYFRKAIQERSIQLAWLLLGTGCLYTYLLAESGPRMVHGNFTWSAQIGLFILFAASAKFLSKRISLAKKASLDWKAILCISILTMHFAFGLFFHYKELIKTELYW